MAKIKDMYMHPLVRAKRFGFIKGRCINCEDQKKAYTENGVKWFGKLYCLKCYIETGLYKRDQEMAKK